MSTIYGQIGRLMKEHDVLVLVTLLILNKQEASSDAYRLRALEQRTGISKSEVANSLGRLESAAITFKNQRRESIQVNRGPVLYGILPGIGYFLPAKIGEITRGVRTAYLPYSEQMGSQPSIPVQFVWPCNHGDCEGLAISPLFKTVPDIVQGQKALHDLLAIIDCLRLRMITGKPKLEFMYVINQIRPVK